MAPKQPPVPKAILFDLDDTLVAWSETILGAWASLCTRYLPDALLDPDDIEALPLTIHNSVSRFRKKPDRSVDESELMANAVAHALSEARIDNPGVAKEMAENYAQERAMVTRLFEGTIATLQYFKERNVKLALVTSGRAETQRAKIDRHDLTQFFDPILIEGELGYGKPEPRIYLEAMEQLGVKPAETWMVGDGLEWDIETALNLGIYGIWVVWASSKYRMMDLPPDAYPESSRVMPDLIIRRVSELPDLLDLKPEIR